MGQVCAKHSEYYEKACPWCEEPEVSPAIITAEEFNARIAEAAAKAPRASAVIGVIESRIKLAEKRIADSLIYGEYRPGQPDKHGGCE